MLHKKRHEKELQHAAAILLPKDEMDRLERKRSLLDDVPVNIKRSRYQDEPVGVEQLSLVAMNATAHSSSSE